MFLRKRALEDNSDFFKWTHDAGTYDANVVVSVKGWPSFMARESDAALVVRDKKKTLLSVLPRRNVDELSVRRTPDRVKQRLGKRLCSVLSEHPTVLMLTAVTSDLTPNVQVAVGEVWLKRGGAVELQVHSSGLV